jgi:hypothetical protein
LLLVQVVTLPGIPADLERQVEIVISLTFAPYLAMVVVVVDEELVLKHKVVHIVAQAEAQVVLVANTLAP